MKKLVIIFFLTQLSLVTLARTYYLSSSTGNDSNDGSSAEKAWASFQKINGQTLKGGDQVLLKAGDRFVGELTIKLQNADKFNVVVSSYGGTAFPLIDGNGANAAIYIMNPENLTIEKLEIMNWKGTYGIYFEAENGGELKNFILQDLDIHNVGYATTTITEPDKIIGGICGKALKGTSPSWWNGLTIQRVNIHNVGSVGITLGGQVRLYEITKTDPYYKPHLNVLIQHCRFDSIVRDGIMLRQCDGAVIQHCTVSQTGLNAVSNGFWFWDCINSVIQYNEGWECHTPQGNDGAPFSIDNHCWNCVIQYNYSHDNEGPGYMLFGRMGDNGGNIIRNNISYNDNIYKTKKTGTACITVSSEVKDALIENNVVIAGTQTHYMLGHRNWEGYPHSVTYKNNLFVGNGRATIAEQQQVLKAGNFQNNFFMNIPGISEKLVNKESLMDYFKQLQDAYDTINKAKKSK